MVQWISTKLGTQVILTKIWHPIDFQGQRWRSQLNFEYFRGLTARGYATLCIALVHLFMTWGRNAQTAITNWTKKPMTYIGGCMQTLALRWVFTNPCQWCSLHVASNNNHSINIIFLKSLYELILSEFCLLLLWRESLNSASQQFYKCQQNELSPLTFTHWTQKRPQHMTLEIQVLAWDRHNNVMGGLRQAQQCDGLNQLMGSFPSW